MWQVILTGLVFGFVSSFHCIGMCGPLVLALPVQSQAAGKQKAAILLYQAGRITTYTVLGALFGFAGRHIFMAGFQRSVSIASGSAILMVLLWAKISAKSFSQSGLFFKTLSGFMRRLWANASLANFALLGAVNGLLPCGMVYFALATSVSFGTISKSIFFMMAFGAGTLALMLPMHYFGNGYISAALRNNVRKAVPVFLVFMGIMLIFRGLNLGIPYLSPNIGQDPSKAVSCH